MPKISDLFVYPVKSCAGVQMNEVSIVPTGFEFDRNWMVVDADGMFVTQREYPKLALVTPAINGGVSLSAPGMEPLHLWANGTGEPVTITLFGEQHVAMATAPDADVWFSRYLGVPCRLVKCDPTTFRKGGVQYPERDAAPTRHRASWPITACSSSRTLRTPH